MSDFVSRFHVEELLAFDKCYAVRAGDNGPFKDGTLDILWRVPYGAEEECKQYLRDERMTFEDFEVSFRFYEGVWRTLSVSSREVRDNGRITASEITHTVARGYAEEAIWAEARIVNRGEYITTGKDTGVADSQPEPRSLVVEFPFCSPEYVDSIASSLSAPEFNSLVVQGESLGSGWNNVGVGATRDDDSWYTITLSLSKEQIALETFQDFGGFRGYKTYTLWNVPKHLAPGIIDQWKYVNPLGSSSHAEYNHDRQLFTLTLRKVGDESEELSNLRTSINCGSETFETGYWGITKELADTIVIGSNPLITGIPEVGATWSIRKNPTGFGTWDVSIRKVVRKSQVRDFGDKISENAFTITTLNQYLGVHPGAMPAFPHFVGFIVNRRIEINDDCTLNITDQRVDPKGVDNAQRVTSTTRFEARDTTVDRNKGAALAEQTIHVDGTIKEVRSEINDFGLYDNSLTERDAAEVSNTGGVSSGTTFETTDGDSSRNLIAEPDPEALDPGKIKQFRKTLNDFGRWDKDGSKRTAIAVPDSQTVKSQNTFEESERDTIRNSAVEARTHNSANGVIETSTVEKSEFPQRIHDTLEKRTATTVADSQTVKSKNTFEESERDTIRNSAVEARTHNSVNGVIETVTVEKSEFPNRIHDALEKRTAIAVPDSQTVKSETKFEKTDRDTIRNAVEPREAPAQADGFIKSQTVEKSEFPDRVHDTEETREAVEQADTGGQSSGTAFEITDGDSSRNLIAEPDPEGLEAGKIKSFRKTLNDFGRWDKDGNKRTATTVSNYQTVKSQNTFEASARDTIRNKAGVARTHASANGVIETVTVEKSEFPERIHDTLEKRTATTVDDAQTVKSQNTFEESERDTIRNKVGVARTHVSADGVIETVTAEKSEFPDRIHDTLEKRTATNVDDAQTVKSETKFEKTERDTIRNAVSPRAAPSQEDGSIKSQTVEKSEFPDRVHDTLEKRTAQYASVSYRSSKEGYLQVHEESHHNDTELPDAESGETVRGDVNQFGRYDYRKKTTTVNPDISAHDFVTYGKPSRQITNWIVNLNPKYESYWNNAEASENAFLGDEDKNDSGDVSTRPVFQHTNTMGWVRWKYTHNITFHPDPMSAAAAISEGHQSSSVRHVGGSVWMADKVTAVVEAAADPYFGA